MIMGIIMESADLGMHNNFDTAMYMVKDHDGDDTKKKCLVTVAFVAQRNGIELGYWDVPNVIHNKRKADKHAFKRVDIAKGIKECVKDARLCLGDLVA